MIERNTDEPTPRYSSHQWCKRSVGGGGGDGDGDSDSDGDGDGEGKGQKRKVVERKRETNLGVK